MKYGNLELQTNEIIVESVQYRHMANRILNTTPISKRSGNKFLSDDFGTKSIQMQGHVISTSASGLLGIIDNMQKYLALSEQNLEIDGGRTYIATCSKAEFPELNYTVTATTFSLEFLSSTPYSYGQNSSAGFTIPSGVTVYTVSTTISGTAFAEPQITLSASGIGNTGFNKVTMYHATTGNSVTISGVYSRDLEAVLNYENATVTYSGILTDYTGSFSKWSAGNNDLIITLEGTNDHGVDGLIEYMPRYYF